MNEELLTRLVTSLEEIDRTLSDISVSLSELSGCISESEEGSRFCIAGDVSNYSVN